MASMSSLTDQFSQNVLNSALWTSATAGGATLSYSVAGASVSFPASSTSATVAYVVSSAAYDLTGSYADLQVTAVPSPATNADGLFILDTTGGAGGSTYLQWDKEGTSLYAQYHTSGGMTTKAILTYSAATHAWWRIRESSGTVYWDTSADGIHWTNQASNADPFAVTALYARLQGSCYENETNPGTFTWNDFNTPTLPVTPPAAIPRVAVVPFQAGSLYLDGSRGEAS